jgi:hypothetical protein
MNSHTQGEELGADGEILFRGEYCGGVKHGRGTMYMRDGGVIVGNWDEGELSGDCGSASPFLTCSPLETKSV